MIAWILNRLATRLSSFAKRLMANDDNPELVRLRRRGVALARENAWLFHDLAQRMFIAEDIDAVPASLIDVSDRHTIKWVWHNLLRDRPRPVGKTPLILDLGANDGLIGSMSLNFVQLGWNAVLVEPLPEMMAMARANIEAYRRPGQTLIFVEAAIGPQDGECHFETEIARDLAQMEGHVVPAQSATSRKVPVIGVDSLLGRPDIAKLVSGAGPIVASIDIEGQDFPVATRMLDAGLRPDIIVIEVLRAGETDMKRIEGYGYELMAHRGWNHIYRRAAESSAESSVTI